MERVLGLLLSAIVLFGSDANADLKRFIKVAEGIYRGDQPDTVEDYETLKSIGIKTLINLRHEESWQGREKDTAAGMGFNYQSYPMNPLNYPQEAQVNAILSDLTNPELQPVYLHCKHGKDRTGMIIGIYRVEDEGWDSKTAYKEMRAIGFNPVFLPLVRYYLVRTRKIFDFEYQLATAN